MKAARLWPVALVSVLALTVIANFWVLWAAGDDQHLALEPDYYRKALAWDSTVAQRERNVALGWRATATLDRSGQLAVVVKDSAGATIPELVMTVEVIPIALAARAATVTLVDGVGRATLVHPGLHELRLVAMQGGTRFTSTLRGTPGGTFRP